MRLVQNIKFFPIILVFFNCFGPFNPDNPAPDNDSQSDTETQQSVVKGTIAHWNFNTNENTLIRDHSGYKNNGSSSNCLWDTLGIDDSGALVFNGTNSFVAVSHDSCFNFGNGNFSVSLWVKPDTLLRYSNNGRYDIISKGEDGQGFCISLYRNKVCGFVGSNIAVTDADTNVLTFDTSWHNLMLIRNQGTVTMYFDNKQVHSYNYTGTVSCSADLYIGKQASRSTYYSGRLDQVKIMNYALTQSDRNSELNRYKYNS